MRTLGALLLLALGACDVTHEARAEPTYGSGVAARDAATQPRDGSTSRDAGQIRDANAVKDALARPDAGSPKVDARPPVDAGTPTIDAGVPIDAAAPAIDAPGPGSGDRPPTQPVP